MYVYSFFYGIQWKFHCLNSVEIDISIDAVVLCSATISVVSEKLNFFSLLLLLMLGEQWSGLTHRATWNLSANFPLDDTVVGSNSHHYCGADFLLIVYAPIMTLSFVVVDY